MDKRSASTIDLAVGTLPTAEFCPDAPARCNLSGDNSNQDPRMR
ncbi:hypothetical protein [uncultured Lamprocystis sp.]|nr:hypothetical protein [uncultured Lamprocystis sp.]